jgi:hypothetical protein
VFEQMKVVINISKSKAVIFAHAGTALLSAPTSNTLQGTNPMGRKYLLSGVTVDNDSTGFVNQSDQKVNCSEDGYVGSSEWEE